MHIQKEPKLSRARQIPEWEAYDAEIARFARRMADEGKISSHAAAEEVNVLAGSARPGPSASPEGEERPEREEGHRKDEL